MHAYIKQPDSRACTCHHMPRSPWAPQTALNDEETDGALGATPGRTSRDLRRVESRFREASLSWGHRQPPPPPAHSGARTKASSAAALNPPVDHSGRLSKASGSPVPQGSTILRDGSELPGSNHLPGGTARIPVAGRRSAAAVAAAQVAPGAAIVKAPLIVDEPSL